MTFAVAKLYMPRREANLIPNIPSLPAHHLDMASSLEETATAQLPDAATTRFALNPVGQPKTQVLRNPRQLVGKKEVAPYWGCSPTAKVSVSPKWRKSKKSYRTKIRQVHTS